MAGLPLFGETFRHWMSGGTATAPKQTTADAKVHMSMSNKSSVDALQSLNSTTGVPYPRLRQPGIRLYTDESCDLPRSNEIMQHLAETSRGSNVQNFDTDGRSIASFGSTVTTEAGQDGQEVTRHAYDNIEAEIDQLKEDVMRLRDQADQGRTTTKTDQELASDRFLSTRSGRQHHMPTDPEPESAAARLQRQHETDNSGNGATDKDHSTYHQQLSEQDFPALGESRPSSTGVTSGDPEPQQRKLSYADAITSGMIHANDHAFSAAMAKHRDNKISDATSEGPLSITSLVSRAQTSSTAATQDSCENREEVECSVIVSPQSLDTESSLNEPVVVSKCQQSVTNGKFAKQSPRFAQSTQSFSRRTGETLRAGSSPVSQKSSPSGSPTKSAKPKEPNLATDKRVIQRQQKRKSLPGDWFDAGGQQPDDTVQDAAGRAANTTMLTPEKTPAHDSVISPSSTDGWQVVEGRHAKENANMMRSKAKQAQGQSPARQKKKSYMAPTNAATQRALATLGEDKVKRETQPQRKPAASHTKAHPETQDTLELRRSNTLSSEGSSVQFILDQIVPNSAPSLKPLGDNAERNREKNHARPTRSRATISASSTLNAVPESSDPKFSSGAPNRARNVNQHVQSNLSLVTDHESFGALPEVANTTTKRRTSRGHLLTPIMACLDAKGLLNQTTSNNAVVESYLKSMSPRSSGSAQKALSGMTSESAQRFSEGSSDAAQQIDRKGPAGKPIAPHLRKTREGSHASTSSDTPCPAPFLTKSGAGQTNAISVNSMLPGGIPLAGIQSSLKLPLSTPSAQGSRVSSLRATANEFKPTFASIDGSSHSNIQAALQFIPVEIWLNMTWEQREAVQGLRQLLGKRGSRSAYGTPPQQSAPRAPLKTATHLWNNTMPQAQSYDLTLKSVNGNGSPNGVQPGQVLKPSPSPGKKTVHWTLQDVDGRETPIKFGRAPAPNVTPIYEPSTPTVSATSSDTTPFQTPHFLRGWQIGSAFSSVPYGWTGGDGKEIKFVGYGPHAERDPNSVVNFSFHGRTGRYAASVPNGFNEDKENHPSEARVAPKSQRQWAEKFGYEKVPCGNVEITHAIEHCIPFGSQLAGYCHDCMAAR